MCLQVCRCMCRCMQVCVHVQMQVHVQVCVQVHACTCVKGLQHTVKRTIVKKNKGENVQGHWCCLCILNAAVSGNSADTSVSEGKLVGDRGASPLECRVSALSPRACGGGRGRSEHPDIGDGLRVTPRESGPRQEPLSSGAGE